MATVGAASSGSLPAVEGAPEGASKSDFFLTDTGHEQRLEQNPTKDTFDDGLAPGASDALLLPQEAQPTAQQQQQQQKRRTHTIDEGTEEHWNLVMKKLAPSGYKKCPAWQKRIVERVIKTMSKREAEESGHDKNPKYHVDLGAIGLSPEIVAALQADEARVQNTMARIGAANASTTRLGFQVEDESQVGKERAPATSLHKSMTERNNQVHYYIRNIQMEQLSQQDLDADCKQMAEEVERAMIEAEGGQSATNAMRSRVARQLSVIQDRCQALQTKASRIGAHNDRLREAINDLRKEKAMHVNSLDKLRAKAAKMDEDISFLTQAAHAALDQREKVKGKFMAAQRDMQQDREAKLSMIKELMERATALDDDWGVREMELADAEEERRRRVYVQGRLRRAELECAETNFGYLANQVMGWESEFERLQEFTRMDKKFEPGQLHIVDEITNRFLEKEQANASLLHYIQEQQNELASLADERRRVGREAAQLHTLLDGKNRSSGGLSVEDEMELSEGQNVERALAVGDLLEQVCTLVQRTTLSTWRPKENPKELDELECNIAHLDRWLTVLDRRITQMKSESTLLCAQAHVQVSPLLVEWTAARKRKELMTVTEIHEALQATARNQHGDLDEEDEDEAERLREKESKMTPFNKVKVDKTKERQQIVDWARKRQAHDKAPGLSSALGALTQRTVNGPAMLAAMQGSPALALRASASAPQLPGNSSRADSPSSSPGRSPGRRSLPRGTSKSEQQRAALDAAAYTAQHGAAPPEHSEGFDPDGSGLPACRDRLSPEAPSPPGRRSKAAQPKRGGGSPPAKPAGGRSARGARGTATMPPIQQGAQSASSPNLSHGSGPPPKDLGTMIYLMGTQSNSMSARQVGGGAQPTQGSRRERLPAR